METLTDIHAEKHDTLMTEPQCLPAGTPAAARLYQSSDASRSCSQCIITCSNKSINNKVPVFFGLERKEYSVPAKICE